MLKKLLFIMIILISNINIFAKTANYTDSLKSESNFSLLHYQNQILDSCQFIHKENFLLIKLPIFQLMILECNKYNLPYSIFFSVVDKESGFRFIPNSTGSGAMGYMQMMPQTFRSCAVKLGLEGGHTPENNIRAGAFHLYELHNFWSKKYSDDNVSWRWALAQYATGLGGLQVKDSNGKVVGYRIPQSCLVGINLVMRNFK